LRGIAVLLVVFYHAFARWAEPIHERTLYPHGNVLFVAPWVATFGQIGVLTFFLTSGFVIIWTLERSSSIMDFVVRRVARLWPAMLVCATLSTVLINATDVAGYFGVERWNVSTLEYFSSLLFLPPNYVAQLFGVAGSHHWVEGVYWTLWHEVRFYALVALVFWLMPRPRFLWAWAAVQSASTAVLVYGMASDDSAWMQVLAIPLQPDMLSWFTLGICGYYLWSGRAQLALAFVALPAVIAILVAHVFAAAQTDAASMPSLLNNGQEYIIVALPFALVVARSALSGLLAWPPLVLIGLISYPLYLFHERPGLVIMMLGERAGLSPILTVIGAIALPIAAAYVIHRLVELPGKRLIVSLYMRVKQGKVYAR
jgi:peptidoglycan/LPS O-acetylase OafA/YrhL